MPFSFALHRAALPALCALGWLVAGVRGADLPPVSTSELCLMLRSGDTEAEVLRDTAGRPLLAPLDADAEKLLRDAGAGPALITRLRATHSLATASQVDAEEARQQQIARQREESWEASQALMMQVSRERLEASAATRAQEALQAMANNLRGKLVIYRDQRIQTYDDSHLPEKRQFAFYFAKLSDPMSQKFTPQLVKFYARYAPAHPEFELVFISQDISSMDMESDVRAYAMPWPAMAYWRLTEEKAFTAPAAKGGLPLLIVVNGTGHLLIDGNDNGKYLGPPHVLDELQRRADAAKR